MSQSTPTPNPDDQLDATPPMTFVMCATGEIMHGWFAREGDMEPIPGSRNGVQLTEKAKARMRDWRERHSA